MTILAFLQKIFPSAQFSYLSTDGSFEANGLELNTEPLSVEILARGEPTLARSDNRGSLYIVTDGTYTSYFRICTAYPDSGYAEYATGQRVIRNDSEEYEDFMRWATSSLTCLTRKYNEN